MPRNVRLPNGVIIENVPDNVTREQVRQKAIETGRARPEDFEQAQAAPQPQTRTAPPPPPEMMAREQQAQRQRAAEAAEYSRARSPGATFEGEVGVFEAARQAAEQAGVNPSKSAPSEARIALAVSAPYAVEPEDQAEVVRNALGEEYDIRVGPDTGKVEWRQKGENKYSLVNPPGFDVRDLVQAVPETATLASGAGVGLGGLAIGASTGNPLVAGTGTTLGVGLGEGLATKIRLEIARDQGYLPEITDEEITQKSLSRGLEASAWTAGGGLVARGARKLLARQLGASTDVIEALGTTPNVDEAFERARGLQREVEQVTGERPPMTAGQAADSPEMRLAEQQAARQGRSGLTDIFESQRRVQESLEQGVTGQPISPDEGRRISLAFERKAKEDIDLLESRAESVQSGLTERAGMSPERAAALARGQIVLGRKRLFDEEFSPKYQQIFDNAEITTADLTPLRTAGSTVRTERGQSILPSVSLTEQRVLKEAENAGLRVDSELSLNSNNLLEWRDKLVSKDTSLTQVQNALVDVRRELRRPGIADEPQKASILREIETSLKQIRSKAVGPEKSSQLQQLDSEYARAAADYNQSFIDEFTTLRADGTPVVTSEAAFNRVIRSPEEANSFVDALGRIPNGGEALSQFKRGVISHVLDKSVKNGEISDAALKKYLDGPKRRALQSVFEGEDIADEFNNLADAVEAVKNRRKQYENSTQVMNRILGERFVSPQKIANETYAKIDRLTPQEVNSLKSALPKSERPLFERALASSIRDEFFDSSGKLQPDKIDNFLSSQGSLAARSVFGETYLSNLRTLRDFARLRQPVTASAADRPIDESLAQIFQRGIGGAEGLQKFLRVPFPPLSVRGRALTASLGQLQETGQRQLAEILADPQRFKDLRRLLSTDFYSRNFDKIAARLGIGSVVQLKNIIQGNIAIPETTEEQGPGSISPTL